MLDEPTSLAGRRHLIDGGYALLLLAIAIVAGYLILAPSDLVATPLARPLPEPRTGLLIDRSRPAEPMRARQSWPKMVTGKILDGDRQPLEGASDRKSTRLNSSHLVISYAVFCLKKKK